MSYLVKLLLSLSLSGSLLLLLLLALKPWYQKRLSQTWQYYIWLIVVARFLIPWNPGNGIVGNLFQQAQKTFFPILLPHTQRSCLLHNIPCQT